MWPRSATRPIPSPCSSGARTGSSSSTSSTSLASHSSSYDLVVAGAGMAGLVAAAHARGQGARVLVLEKGDRAGGSMLLSSGVVWRHRAFDDFRAECAGGDEQLQRILFERLDSDVGWLESLGARPVTRETENAR